MQHSLRYCTWQQTGSSGWPLDGAATTALLVYRPIAAKIVACNVCNFGNIWTLILLEYRKYFGRQKVVKPLSIYKAAQTKTTYDLQPRLDELLKRPLSKHSSSSGGKFQWQPIIFSNHGMLSVCRAKLENGTSFLRYSQKKQFPKRAISKKLCVCTGEMYSPDRPMYRMHGPRLIVVLVWCNSIHFSHICAKMIRRDEIWA